MVLMDSCTLGKVIMSSANPTNKSGASVMAIIGPFRALISWAFETTLEIISSEFAKITLGQSGDTRAIGPCFISAAG